jgi:hypothetical protein
MNKPYWEIIDKLDIEPDAKDGYKWLLANYEAVKRATAKAKTIGEVQRACLKTIGFAPAIIDCFFKRRNKEQYLKRLVDNHK